MRLALSLSILLVAGVAGAQDVWQRALGEDRADPKKEIYERLLQAGDDAVKTANAHNVSYQALKHNLKNAEDLYRQAAAAKPDSAEPYFRIGYLLNNFYFACNAGSWHPYTCDSTITNIAVAKRAVDAWDEFERRVPLDPRVTEILVERAILRTKLVTGANDKANLEAAARDYEAYLDRTDGSGTRSHVVLGNLAETYMMLGRLDDAVTTYEQAVKAGGAISTVYGLAVALDRDERGADALDRIVRQGLPELEAFRTEFRNHDVFYVPAGEEYYYFALTDEAFGETEEAIEYWQKYIRSGAHPEYQPRAKQHLDDLMKHRKPHARPAPDQMWPQDLLP